jgi:ABC-type polysaccharide/polyol phosphate export permease
MTALALDSLLVARRNLAHIRQIPEKLLDVTLQPLMFVLLFAFVFGGVIALPEGNYREYLIGGILVQTIAFGMIGPGTSLATDLKEGIVDRFRTLPMARSAFLLGHMLAEFAGMVIAITILSIAGLIVGWRIDGGVPHALAGYGLMLAFALAMVWIGLLVGVSVRSPDAVMGIGFTIVFPLTFVASTFVPVAGLPAGLEQFAEWNPISALAAAAREQFGNPAAVPHDAAWPLMHPALYSLVFCAAILAAVVPLTLSRYRARTSD